MEILFEDKLSTDRCRRDARGAKFEILFTERSNRSRFIHSPMHPSSCIPVRHAICDLVETFLNTEKNRILILKRVLPRPLSLRKRIDSKSNSPVRDLSRAAVILSQSASAGIREIRLEQHTHSSVLIHATHPICESTLQKPNAPSTTSLLSHEAAIKLFMQWSFKYWCRQTVNSVSGGTLCFSCAGCGGKRVTSRHVLSGRVLFVMTLA